MVNGQLPMLNGQWSIANVQCSIESGADVEEVVDEDVVMRKQLAQHLTTIFPRNASYL